MTEVDLPRPVSGRVLRDSRRWFVEGLAARQLARRTRRCVECARPLSSGRTPYCSRGCLWKYHGHFFWDAARRVVLHRDRFTCRACGRRARKRELEVDHVVEIARGGAPLDLANLQTLCRSCHRVKTVRFLRTRPGRAVSPSSRVCGDEDADWFPA